MKRNRLIPPDAAEETIYLKQDAEIPNRTAWPYQAVFRFVHIPMEFLVGLYKGVQPASTLLWIHQVQEMKG